jgi:hypothetical protein
MYTEKTLERQSGMDNPETRFIFFLLKWNVVIAILTTVMEYNFKKY